MSRRGKYANIVFGSAIALCLSLLLYAYFLSVLTPNQLTKYYTVSIAGMLLFGLAFRLDENTKVNVALVVTSVGVSVYLTELFLHALQKPVEPLTVARQIGIDFDARTKLQVIRDLREWGIDAYPIVPPCLFMASLAPHVDEERIYPLGGVSDKLTVNCNESGEWSVYHSDEHGFNNPQGLYENREVDVVLLGDSYTQGACVKVGEDIGSLLRMGDRKVLNLDYACNAPLTELAALKEYGKSFRPKTVLWFYYEGNDLSSLLEETRVPVLLKYLDQGFSQNLLVQQRTIGTQLMQYVQNNMHEHDKKKNNNLNSILRLFNLRQLLRLDEHRPSFAEEGGPLFRQVLAQARDQVMSWGGKLYFVYLPGQHRYAFAGQENLFHRNEVLHMVQELGLPIIDFHEIVFSHPEPLSFFPFRLAGHYTAEGYRRLAEQIEMYLD